VTPEVLRFAASGRGARVHEFVGHGSGGRAAKGEKPYEYRLSKFQDCLPERFALEVIENYLLDVAGTVRWLGGNVEEAELVAAEPERSSTLTGEP
jgi:hypothetical protein